MRIIKSALQNSFRNPWLSVTSILITFLMLFSISILYGINIIGQQILDSFKNKMDLGIYLKQNVNENTVNLLRSELENLEQVKELRYLTPEQSLKEFEQRHQNNPLILKSLKELEENPLGVTITLKFYDPADYQLALSIIDKPEYTELIQEQDFYDYQKLIQGFNTFTQKISYVGLGMSGFFIFIAILIIFNTIKLGALSRQEEIKIMRLVGGTSWFIRAPFLIESSFYALVAWLLNLGVILLIAFYSNTYIQQFLELDFNLYLHLTTKGLIFLIGLLIYALIISMIGSSLAIKKYLKF
ncbi:FtsX-like permease family protein [Patescibacteria group bacterium]|nr:FtsX-like permease family protein [Patescibacteria group bacterium]